MIYTPKVLRMKEGPAVFNKNAGLIVFVEPLWPSSFGFGKQKFDEWGSEVAVDRAASNKKHFTISNQGNYHWFFHHRPLRVSAILGQASRLKVLSVSCKIDHLPEEMGHLAKMEGNEQANGKKTTDNQNPNTSSTSRTIGHTENMPYWNTMQNLYTSPQLSIFKSFQIWKNVFLCLYSYKYSIEWLYFCKCIYKMHDICSESTGSSPHTQLTAFPCLLHPPCSTNPVKPCN